MTLHFLASLLGGTLLYHRSPLSWYHFAERRSCRLHRPLCRCLLRSYSSQQRLDRRPRWL